MSGRSIQRRNLFWLREYTYEFLPDWVRYVSKFTLRCFEQNREQHDKKDSHNQKAGNGEPES